jgi:hypothetical protein
MLLSGHPPVRTDRSARPVTHPCRCSLLVVACPACHVRIAGWLHHASSPRRPPMVHWKRMLQTYVLNVSNILEVRCRCFIWMLHTLQWLYTYVATVYSKCFIYFRRILQVYYLDVAYVAVAIHICCNHMFQLFHMLQTYVAASAFMLQVSWAGAGGLRVQQAAVGACSRAGNSKRVQQSK